VYLSGGRAESAPVVDYRLHCTVPDRDVVVGRAILKRRLISP
jgi:hypothetical protein